MQNAHVQTVYPTLFRKCEPVNYQRERILTDDDDFLDLDWSQIGSSKLAILSHGLEGNSRMQYVVGMVKQLNQHGWDALAWNYRSCSGEINRQLRFYHNGVTDDLDRVIQRAQSTEQYNQIALIGFSLGGNLTLNYLGWNSASLSSLIARAVVFSVPCDLTASSGELAKPKCRLYMKRFLRSFHHKIREKMAIMPDQIDDKDFHQIKNFKDYDDRYTAPIHGFKSAEDYWIKCSSQRIIPDIRIPTLIVNAKNDPFLSGGCYPVSEAEKSNYVWLEMPASGGHVGFIEFKKQNIYWSEARAVEFLNEKKSENG